MPALDVWHTTTRGAYESKELSCHASTSGSVFPRGYSLDFCQVPTL